MRFLQSGMRRQGAWFVKPSRVWTRLAGVRILAPQKKEVAACVVCPGKSSLPSASRGRFSLACSGKLLWVGNLCIRGVRAKGNWPRSPLVVAEVQEAPFALKRSAITVIDEQAPSEPETVQHSNFRFYQDRLSGELVLFLTRFAERDAKEWKHADYYRYRVTID